MIAHERRNKIMRIINAHGSVRAAEIAKSMGVSTETIRKDLVILNDSGLIKKKFGGAIAVNEFVEQPVKTRAMENREAKRRIAARALPFLEGNNVVFLDSGSTLLCLAEVFPADKGLAVVTNSFMAVEYLANTANSLFFVGGEVSSVTMATSGYWSSFSLNSLKIDIAFLGTSGFQSHDGPCSKTFTDAQFKIEVIKNSRKVVVLADSSKFRSNAITQFTPWETVDTLITDDGAPREGLDAISTRTNIIIA